MVMFAKHTYIIEEPTRKIFLYSKEDLNNVLIRAYVEDGGKIKHWITAYSVTAVYPVQ